MDYIEKRLNEFIEEVKTFEHSYSAEMDWKDKMVYSWKNEYTFYSVMLDILDFIEEESSLHSEYNYRIGLLKNIIDDCEFIETEQKMQNIIVSIWGRIKDKTIQNKEFEEEAISMRDYCSCDQEPFPAFLRKKPSDIQMILDMENYYKIRVRGHAVKEIRYLINQYEYMCFPKDTKSEDLKEYRALKNNLIIYLDKLRKLKAQEFSIFNAFSSLYKIEVLMPSMENHSQLQSESYETNSIELVSSTLDVLKELKKHYIKSKSLCSNPKESYVKDVNKKLTAEEIEFLRLRKTSEDRRFKNICLKMSTKHSEDSLKQLSKTIRNKLGADDIDQAIIIYEENYEKL